VKSCVTDNVPKFPGHWFCSFCNDVVNIQKPWGRWDARRGVNCPVCHHNSANWIPEKKTIAPETAKANFDAMREETK